MKFSIKDFFIFLCSDDSLRRRLWEKVGRLITAASSEVIKLPTRAQYAMTTI